MPLTAAQTQFNLYGWHAYPWASTPRPVSSALTATPTAGAGLASVVVQLPASSQAAKVTAEAGRRSGAPDHRSASANVAGGGSATLIVPDLPTGVLHYVRAVATYADGTQVTTAVETTVTPT